GHAVAARNRHQAAEGVKRRIDSDATAAATTAVVEFARPAIRTDGTVAGQRAGRQQDTAAGTAAAVVLKRGIAARADPAIDRQGAAHRQPNRPTAFAASSRALPASTAAAAAVNGLLRGAIGDAAGRQC